MMAHRGLPDTHFTPGPDGKAVKPTRRPVGMGSRQRLTTPQGGAVGIQQFTPDQQFFRDNAASRWSADPAVGAHAPVNALRQDEQGCTDVTALEPSWNPTGTDSYLDLGGKGGVDFAARRP